MKNVFNICLLCLFIQLILRLNTYINSWNIYDPCFTSWTIFYCFISLHSDPSRSNWQQNALKISQFAIKFQNIFYHKLKRVGTYVCYFCSFYFFHMLVLCVKNSPHILFSILLKWSVMCVVSSRSITHKKKWLYISREKKNVCWNWISSKRRWSQMYNMLCLKQ